MAYYIGFVVGVILAIALITSPIWILIIVLVIRKRKKKE